MEALAAPWCLPIATVTLVGSPPGRSEGIPVGGMAAWLTQGFGEGGPEEVCLLPGKGFQRLGKVEGGFCLRLGNRQPSRGA